MQSNQNWLNIKQSIKFLVFKLIKQIFKSYIVTKFLNIDLEYAGWLPESKTIAGSIVSRKPAILKKSLEPVLSKNFSDIASYMANVKVTKTGGIKFFNKWWYLHDAWLLS